MLVEFTVLASGAVKFASWLPRGVKVEDFARRRGLGALDRELSSVPGFQPVSQ